MASLGRLGAVMESSRRANGTMANPGNNGAAQTYKVNVDSAKLLVIDGQRNYIFTIAPLRPRAVTFRNLTVSKKGATVIAFLTTYTPTRRWAKNYNMGKTEKFEGRVTHMQVDLNDNNLLQIGQVPKVAAAKTTAQQKNSTMGTSASVTENCVWVVVYEQVAYKCASGTHGPEDTCYLTGDDRAGYRTAQTIRPECDGGGGGTGSGTGTSPGTPPGYNPCDGIGQTGGDNNGPGENQVPGGEIDVTDCDPQIPQCPAGSYWSNECNTCIGGTTGLTGCPREIRVDTSINNNPKIKCLMEKLLGLDGTAGNAQMKSLLAAFNSKGFDVTFKIGTTKPESWGETAEDPYNPTKYNVVLNRNKINGGYQMDWVKTLLHEAFHANLLQKTYELFGASAIALWDKNPGNMSFNELMDYVNMKAETSGNPVLKVEHHNFMARNFEVIRDGLKSFSLDNNPTHSNYNDSYFDALSYQGLTGTSYYINKISKDANGIEIRIEYSGGNYTLAEVHSSKADALRINSTIPCN